MDKLPGESTEDRLKAINSLTPFTQDLARRTVAYYAELTRGQIIPDELAMHLARDWHAMQLEALAPFYRMFVS